MKQLSIKHLFDQLLVATWLRPERALFDAHLLHKVNSFLGTNWNGPSMEYGCTDGVPSFVMLGGKLNPLFDDYSSVNWHQTSHTNHSGLKTDYFDSMPKERLPFSAVEVAPSKKFDFGVSWKDSHIEKARELGIYRNLLVEPLGGTLNSFAAESLDLIFAPNLFWIEQDLLLATIVRLQQILRKGSGKIITIFPDACQKKHLVYNYTSTINQGWADDLDRGIHNNLVRHARTIAEWHEIFDKCGLQIDRSDRFLPAQVNYIYQIGMRPMFPVFMNMHSKLKSISQESLADVKNHWMEASSYFLEPLCDSLLQMQSLEIEHTWNIFELSRK